MSALDTANIPDIENAKLLAAERQRQTEELFEHKKQAKKEKSYASGADYVSQSSAAQAEFEKRQMALNSDADGIRMFDYGEPQPIGGSGRAKDATNGPIPAEKKRQEDRIARLLRNTEGEDLQPKAPGGGRTRSR